MRKPHGFSNLIVLTGFIFACFHCSGDAPPVTPEKALNKICGILTYIGMDYDSDKLKTDFVFLRKLVEDTTFFMTVYNYKQQDYESDRFYVKSIANKSHDKAEAVVEIRFVQKNSRSGFSKPIMSPILYHFTLSRRQDVDSTFYWCIVKSTEGAL